MIPKKTYQLTKVSDIIGIGAKNRECIISIKNGTDFSGDNRIKYELWKIKNPGDTESYIIAVHHNINVQQTIERAFTKLKDAGCLKGNILILSPRENRTDLDIIQSTTDFNIIKKTYDEYVWEYCISSEFKSVIVPDIIDFYTQQEISDGNKSYPSAVKHLTQLITKPQNNQNFSGHIIIGSGGIGKTSLCHSLANYLNKKESTYITIFISSEDIRKYISKNGLNNLKINGLYDLYEIQSKHLEHINIFDRNTFELSLVSGKIIILIDGLDELVSIFGENFNIENFLHSIANLHNELGASRFILTTRQNPIISDELLENLQFNKFELLGFKIENCEKYLNQRFEKYQNSENIISKIINKIETSTLTNEQRIIPFFIDVISNIFEDNIESKSDANLEIIIEDTPYPSLNTLNDHLIFSIFNREKTRHKFSISAVEMLTIFIDLNIELTNIWLYDDIKNNIEILIETAPEKIIDALLKNPLLKQKENKTYTLKYDFLQSYFNNLALFNFFEQEKINNDFIKTLTKLNKDSNEFKDIVIFLKSKENLPKTIKPIINELSEKYMMKTGKEKEKAIKFIEKIISLLSSINKNSPEDFNNSIREIYNTQEKNNTIKNLFINDDIHNLNFKDLKIMNSHFKNYPKFLKSNFTNSKFSYCNFENCHSDKFPNSNFLEATIDKSNCEIGDLEISYGALSKKSEENEIFAYEEMHKFLSSFYRGGAFRDNNKMHIRFSKHVSGLMTNNFDKLISNNIIIVSSKKEVDTFYAISETFKGSVRRFLNDGYKDSKIKNIYKIII